MNPLLAAIKALQQARNFNVPVLKILPGLFVEYDKIYILSQFGAATEKLEKATVRQLPHDAGRSNNKV